MLFIIYVLCLSLRTKIWWIKRFNHIPWIILFECIKCLLFNLWWVRYNILFWSIVYIVSTRRNWKKIVRVLSLWLLKKTNKLFLWSCESCEILCLLYHRYFRSLRVLNTRHGAWHIVFEIITWSVKTEKLVGCCSRIHQVKILFS